MSVNWQAAEALAVWLAAVAAIVNVAFFLRYLRLMRGIAQATVEQARAAAEQAEGQSKPVVAVACRGTLPEDESEWLEESVPAEIEGERIQLINVGSGPALNLGWSYERERGVFKGERAYLQPGERYALPLPVERGINERRIQCEYVSARGVSYISTTTLRDRYVVGSSVRVVGRAPWAEHQ